MDVLADTRQNINLEVVKQGVVQSAKQEDEDAKDMDVDVLDYEGLDVECEY